MFAFLSSLSAIPSEVAYLGAATSALEQFFSYCQPVARKVYIKVCFN